MTENTRNVSETIRNEPKTERPEVPKNKPLTIRALAVVLLCRIDFYEDHSKVSSVDNRVTKDHPNAYSVGISYKEVLKIIHETFPNCKTTVACLRWYSVKIRVEEPGYENLDLVQRRPRSMR